MEDTICSLCSKRQVPNGHPDLTALREAVKANRKDIEVQKKEMQGMKIQKKKNNHATLIFHGCLFLKILSNLNQGFV